jgi:sigma-B regulation protein RsbU (phosphoserine phosphatase)
MLKTSIRNMTLFNGATPEEIENILSIGQVREYTADVMLFHEGDPGDYFSIILEGQVDIIKFMGTPEERLLVVMGPGEFLGEMSLLHPDQKRTAGARTRTAFRQLEMTKEDFKMLLNEQPEVALRVMQEMSQRLRNHEHAIIHDLRQRNQELIQAYKELQEAQQQIIEKEKLEHEISLARSIQESSLPTQLPQPEGWRISACWQPARTVSGDFYDVVQQPKDMLRFFIADVSGKGVPAAMVMATSRSVLRTLIVQEDSPARILSSANDVLFEQTPAHMFITCFLGILDLDSGHLRFANAGHNLPYKLNSTDVHELHARGMPLGMLPGSQYDDQEISLDCGERIFLYSDGLVEAHRPDGEMFGDPRLKHILTSLPSESPLIENLLAALDKFTGEIADREDDVTFVVVERLSSS